MYKNKVPLGQNVYLNRDFRHFTSKQIRNNFSSQLQIQIYLYAYTDPNRSYVWPVTSYNVLCVLSQFKIEKKNKIKIWLKCACWGELDSY